MPDSKTRTTKIAAGSYHCHHVIQNAEIGWACTPVIPALRRRRRQEDDPKFQTTLGCIVRVQSQTKQKNPNNKNKNLSFFFFFWWH
jgi:hypothetical protein